MSSIKAKLLGVVVIMSLLLYACSTSTKKDSIQIATAANMQFAMEALLTEFTSSTGYKATAIVSSSGKLTAQIKAGAPYDVFVSADMNYPTHLYEEKYAIEAPKVYANGSLVLWTLQEVDTLTLDILTAEKIQHIAIADADLAPYGRATMEYLESKGIKDQLIPKMVFAQSISGVNQYITTQAAEVGFTAKSVVVSPEMKGKGSWISIPKTKYKPIDQGVVLLNYAAQTKAQQKKAKVFYQFLFSDKAQKILQEYGYFTPY